MNALQDQGLGRLDRFIESHDPIGFFRPEELPSAELPGEASHVAEPLGLRQIGFAPTQRAYRRLQIIARAPERFLRAPLRYAEPNHEKRGHRKKSEARYGLNGKRIRRRNEVVIKSQNGERGCEQTRARAAEPRGEKGSAKKQGYVRGNVQKPVRH